jgi:hypothetical protein
MATYAQLKREPWWDAEKQPATIKTLCDRIRARYGLAANAVGSKGDNAPGHMRGYHRSRAWLLNSIYCTNRLYSVVETEGNRSGGDDDWLAATDFTLPDSILLPMCRRLDAAVRAGRLEKITEWYGNVDGDTRVDGYNNIKDRVATSDSSHLWHLHLSFDRGRAGEDHTDLYDILTGDDMTPDQSKHFHFLVYRVLGMQTMQDPIRIPAAPAYGVSTAVEEPNLLARAVLAAGGTVELSDEDLAAIAAAAEAGAEAGAPTPAEIADAVVDEQHDRLAE